MAPSYEQKTAKIGEIHGTVNLGFKRPVHEGYKSEDDTEEESEEEGEEDEEEESEEEEESDREEDEDMEDDED